MAAREPKTLVVIGAGKLGGAVIDLLAARYPQHRYVIVSRDIARAQRRANLTRYVCSQWGRYPSVEGDATDLLDIDRTASLLSRHQPEIVFNATTPFPWWLIDAMGPEARRRVYEAGLGMWSALDCLLPMYLSMAMELLQPEAIYVNGCYPDMVNVFLANQAFAPRVGIGNMSNLVPGLRLAYAEELGVHPRELMIQLICHHFISLNAPTFGGCGGAPYHLTITYPGGCLRFADTDDTPFALLKARSERVRGLDGQGVTVSSAATVVASFLKGERRDHHAPGPLGLPGGYPIRILEDGNVALNLPDDTTRDTAIDINTRAQAFDGIDHLSPGRVSLTTETNDAFREVVGFELPPIDRANVLDVSREIVECLSRRYNLDLRL
jgi:hypothetical protein